MLIIVVLTLLPFLFWWRLWALDIADRATIPSGDFTEQYYPLQLFAARAWAEGRLPAWDPYLNGGQPGLADIQTGAFYPPNLIANLVLIVLGVPYGLPALTAQVLLHFALASLGTYLFVRQLARRSGARLPAARFAGAVGAITFTYAGYLTSFPVQQVTILETAVWLPLVLYGVDRTMVQPQPTKPAIFTGLALACALLAGHPQTAMHLVYATLAYTLFSLWSSWRTGTQGATGQAPLPGTLARRFAYAFVVPLVLGFAVAALQLLPTLAFIVQSTRAGLDYDSVSWGLPLAEVTHFLYPGYFGSSPQYIGILPPILAAAALLVPRARRQAIFWFSLAGITLLLTFGGNTFLYSVAYLLAPGFGAVRNQERIIYLFSFAISVLAGLGALVLVQPLPPAERRGFAQLGRAVRMVGLILLALTAIFYFGFLQGLQQEVKVNMFEGALRHHTFLLLILGGSIVLLALRQSGGARRPWLMVITLSLIGLNLFTINWRFNLAEPPTDGPFPRTGLVEFLQSQPGVYRVSTAGLLPGGANAGIVHNIEDITGNTPLRLEAFQQFEDQVGSWRRWQLLNVHYVVSDRELDGPGMERVYKEGEVRVYQVGDPLPRAWIVNDVETASDAKAYARLNADDLDPRRTGIVPPGSPLTNVPPGGQGSVSVVERRPGSLVLDLDATQESVLLISQPFYPGWHATVDGQTATIHRADVLLQALAVSAGTHRIEISYRLAWWPFALSASALLACVAALVLLSRQSS